MEDISIQDTERSKDRTDISENHTDSAAGCKYEPEFKVHVFHTGKVCISPDLAFGGEHCSPFRATGLFLPEITNGSGCRFPAI